MSDSEQEDSVIELATRRAETPADQRTTAQIEEINRAAGGDALVLDRALQRLRHTQEPQNWKDIADALTDAAQHDGHEVQVGPGLTIRPRKT